MVFEVLVADEAPADHSAITGFIRDNGSPLEANRWLEAIAGRIASLRSMPGAMSDGFCDVWTGL